MGNAGGACVPPDILARATALGLRPRESLEYKDGDGFFQAPWRLTAYPPDAGRRQ